MTAHVVPYWIQIINLLLLGVVLWLVYYNYRKCYTLDVTALDYNFYLLQLQSSVSFGLANIVAAYVNYMLFFVLDLKIPLHLSFLRYIDRLCMLIHSLYLVLMSTKYIPNWFKK